MKILLDIPVTLYDKVIEGKADKRTMITIIEHGRALLGNDRLLSESELINELEIKKKQFEASLILIKPLA